MGRLSIDDTAALIMGMEALEELGRDQVAGFEPGEMVRPAWVRSTVITSLACGQEALHLAPRWSLLTRLFRAFSVPPPALGKMVGVPAKNRGG